LDHIVSGIPVNEYGRISADQNRINVHWHACGD
jgi:hypothetical protein